MSNVVLDLMTGNILLTPPKTASMEIRCVEKATDLVVGTNIVGTIIAPFYGRIIGLRAVVDVAGVTGSSVIDINIAGERMMMNLRYTRTYLTHLHFAVSTKPKKWNDDDRLLFYYILLHQSHSVIIFANNI